LLGQLVKKKEPPYAADLYNIILQDRKNIPHSRSIRVLSDQQLSDDGLKVWKRLFNKGHSIMIYDANDPSIFSGPITSEAQLLLYFKKNDASYCRWQYVLSENKLSSVDINTFFHTYRLRKLAGFK